VVVVVALRLQSRKKSAGYPGCFQHAIDWHKPPKRAQKRQFGQLNKKRGAAFVRHYACAIGG
jgi:hypothetical protein